MLKKILQETTRFFVYCTTKKLRQKIYAVPFFGNYLQNILRGALGAVLYTDDFQWFKFQSGCRAGLEMNLKLPEESEFYLETHDPEVTALLCKYIGPGFTVIDVGAHIGYFTLLISRIVGQTGKVFALEPLPKNAKRLKEHLLRNNCNQNTRVLELAAADCDTQEQFYEFGFATIGRFSSAQSFVKDKPSGCMTVNVRSLDSLFNDGSIEAPDFVKIDVEGAELRVLRGMENLLKARKPKLLVEIHNEKIVDDIANFLASKGFEAYYVNGKALKESNFAQSNLLGKSILFICNYA